jgi:hypothetical protein
VTGKRLAPAMAFVFVAVTAYAQPISEVRQLEIAPDYGSVARSKGPDLQYVICDGCEANKGLVPMPPPRKNALAGPIAVRNTGLSHGEKGRPGELPGRSVRRPAVAHSAGADVREGSKKIEAHAGAAGGPSESAIAEGCRRLRVFFRYRESDIGVYERDQLKKILPCIKSASVRIEGFTCPIGSQSRNDRLAEARAASVARFLKNRGFKVTGHGGKGRQGYISSVNRLNRRVEIIVESKGGGTS